MTNEEEPRQAAVRAILTRRLTPTQMRRTSLLCGLDGEALSLREIASREGVSHQAVHMSWQQAQDKLAADGYLWCVWILCNFFTVDGPDIHEAADTGDCLDAYVSLQTTELTEPDEDLEGSYVATELRPSGTRWETDRYQPSPRTNPPRSYQATAGGRRSEPARVVGTVPPWPIGCRRFFDFDMGRDPEVIDVVDMLRGR